MWVKRSISASGVYIRRFLSLLAISSFMAILAVTGPLTQVVSAIDAIWTGETLTYDGKVHTETTTAPDRPGEPNEFEWRLNTGGPTIATVLYFGNNPGNQQEATLVEYDILNGNYTQSAPPQTVSVTRDLTVDDNGSAESVAGTTCNVTGIGWIICPLASWLSEGVDWVYGIIEGFLEVQTITTSDSGVYQIWQLIRNIANVCFLFVFIAIVYSQLTGIGISNHNIKDMIPRLVIGAALVNVSFWICALAVDASNLLGYSIQSIFVTVRENIIMTPAISGENYTWAGITAVILGGGYAAIAGAGAAAAGSGISLSFLLIAALLPAAFAVLVAFVILAARQALIVVLTMIAPLAFVAFVLPSTQNLFHKWRKAFTTLLVFFPIFALIFGGSQLAGTAILNSSQDAQPAMQLPLILIGMATMVVPLIITPLLVRFSSGLLGQIANFANSKNRGLIDRAQGWARDNAELHKSNKMVKSNGRASMRRPYTMLSPSRMGRRFDYNKREREARKKLNEEALAARQDRDWQESLHSPAAPGRVRSRLGMQSPQQRRHDIHEEADILQRKAKAFKDDHHAHADQHWNQYLQDTTSRLGDGQGARYRDLRESTHIATGLAKQSDEDMTNADEVALKAMIHGNRHLREQSRRASVNAKRATAYQDEIDAEANERWVNEQSTDQTFRRMRTRTDIRKQRAEAIDKSMSTADQRMFDELVNTSDSPVYQRVRGAKIQTIVDSGHSELQTKLLDSEGKMLFKDEVMTTPGLQRIVADTVANEKAAGIAETIVQKNAEAEWDNFSRTDQATQRIRLQEAAASDRAKLAETQWSELVQQAMASGSDATLVRGGNRDIAVEIQDTAVQVSAYESAISNLKDEQQAHLLQQLNKSQQLQQIAGGGTKYGATKVLAKTQSGLTQMILENAKAMKSIYSNEGYRVDEMFEAMNPDGILRGGKEADAVAKFAAISYVMEDIGNNWAVEKTIDRMIREHGMEMATDDDGEVITDSDGEPIYYDARKYREAKRSGGPLPPALTAEEVSTRRDTLQMVVDGYKKGRNKVSWFTNTMQERVNRGLSNIDVRAENAVGRELTASEAAILSEIQQGKYEGSRIAAMDPDELSRMVQSLRNPELRRALTEGQRQLVTDAIRDAQTSEQTRFTIKPRERGIMNAVATYLELGERDNPPTIDEQRQLENIYYEVIQRDGDKEYSVRVPAGTPGARQVWAASAAPTEYSMDRQDDIAPTGKGLYEGRGGTRRPDEMPPGL
jgi:hypothetical protein